MPSTLTASPLVATFAKIRSALEAETINRHDEIDAFQVALLTRTHLFMLSGPGMGKTMLVDRTLARISGANLFTRELNKFIEEDDLIGPKSIKAFREDRDERRTAGYLPEADVAFLDEIWNANSAALKALHSILNERRLSVGDHVIDIPLSTLVSSSNQLPSIEHSELAAAYDRLHQRLVPSKLIDPADLRRLLKLRIDPNPQPLITWDEVLVAQAETAALPVTDEAVDAIVAITLKLRAENVTFSERRLRWCEQVAKGSAWLAGDDAVRPDHLGVLRNMLWDNTDQRSIVDRVVMEVASDAGGDVIVIADLVAEQSELFDKGFKLEEGDPGRGAVMLEVRKKIERAMADAVELEDRATGRAAAALADTMRRMDNLHAAIALEVAGVTGTKSLADSVRSSRK